MYQGKSALIKRLENYEALSDSEIAALANLQDAPKKRGRRHGVFDSAEPDKRIAIVHKGWAVLKISSDPNVSFISQIFMAGDIIGMTDIGVPQ